jgi:DUF1680 family protein
MSVPSAQVALLDPYLVNATDKTRGYLDRLDPATFLYSFYTEAGLEPPTPSGYGGWERTTGLRFQGHFFGHYLSALAQAYSASEPGEHRDEQLADLTVAVAGLDTCQRAYGSAHPDDSGYVAPFPVDFLPSGSDGLLVPFYNLHKVLAGLLHVHQFLPAGLGDTALRVAAGFGSWIGRWAARQPDPGVILATEYGGMNDALYELYALTRDPAHKRAAECFDELELFWALADGRDVLNGLHANTTIPKLIGALKRYLVHTSDDGLYAGLTDAEKSDLPRYRSAAENFWRIVIDDHTYANGANSQSEHFHEAGSLCRYATNGATTGYGENSTAEGCNEYNMLKLTRLLFELTRQPEYADYYESTFINSILASQNPETGMVTYFQPMAPGYAKVFGRELDEFWCDHGTGIESFTKLGDSIYFTDATSVYVTMFRSSTARIPHLNLQLSQVADVPASADVVFTVGSLNGEPFDGERTLRIRVPAWIDGAPTVTVNGALLDLAPADGFLSVPVAAGDEVHYGVPAALRLDDSTENPNFVAITFGPVLLARALSREGIDADYEAGVLVRMGVADPSLTADLPVSSVADWKEQLAGNLIRVPGRAGTGEASVLRFELSNEQSWTFEPYFSLYDARYAIYTTLIEPDSADAQARIRATKEQLRAREVTLDSLTSFDNNNSEADKNYATNRSSVGTFDGRTFRRAEPGGWFSYEFARGSGPDTVSVGVLLHSHDADQAFDLVVDGAVIAREPRTTGVAAAGAAAAGAAATNGWFTEWYRVPGDPAAENDTVTLRFQGVGTSPVPSVFGIDVRSRRDFDDDPRLAGLAVSVGELRPAFSPDLGTYTLAVPRGTASVGVKVTPRAASGLVTVDGVLVDDGEWRALELDGTARTVVVTASAQDHTTETTVEVTVVPEHD